MVFGRGIPAFDHLKSMFPKEYEFTLWYCSWNRLSINMIILPIWPAKPTENPAFYPSCVCREGSDSPSRASLAKAGHAVLLYPLWNNPNATAGQRREAQSLWNRWRWPASRFLCDSTGWRPSFEVCVALFTHYSQRSWKVSGQCSGESMPYRVNYLHCSIWRTTWIWFFLFGRHPPKFALALNRQHCFFWDFSADSVFISAICVSTRCLQSSSHAVFPPPSTRLSCSVSFSVLKEIAWAIDRLQRTLHISVLILWRVCFR